MTENGLQWQSKLILLLVIPYVAVGVTMQARALSSGRPDVVMWGLGLSALLGLAAWRSRAATPAAALTGALIAASVTFSTAMFPYEPWRTALVPVLVVLVLTSLATRFGRKSKESLGTAEKKHGRGAAQVAANLGLAALVLDPTVQSWLAETRWLDRGPVAPVLLYGVGLAALAEAAADTVSSEIGQVLGGQPRMITTLRRVEPGTDGGITFAGTAAGIIAAGIVSTAGTMALRGGSIMLLVSWVGAVFGLVFDSLLGATIERSGGLNNDGVNFLSTGSAAAFALSLLALLPHLAVR